MLCWALWMPQRAWKWKTQVWSLFSGGKNVMSHKKVINGYIIEDSRQCSEEGVHGLWECVTTEPPMHGPGKCSLRMWNSTKIWKTSQSLTWSKVKEENILDWRNHTGKGLMPERAVSGTERRSVYQRLEYLWKDFKNWGPKGKWKILDPAGQSSYSVPHLAGVTAGEERLLIVHLKPFLLFCLKGIMF